MTSIREMLLSNCETENSGMSWVTETGCEKERERTILFCTSVHFMHIFKFWCGCVESNKNVIQPYKCLQICLDFQLSVYLNQYLKKETYTLTSRKSSSLRVPC